MQWEDKTPTRGDKRIVTKFAWFPKSNGEKVVWLEKYQVEQRYDSSYDGWTSWWDIKLYFQEK